MGHGNTTPSTQPVADEANETLLKQRLSDEQVVNKETQLKHRLSDERVADNETQLKQRLVDEQVLDYVTLIKSRLNGDIIRQRDNIAADKVPLL